MVWNWALLNADSRISMWDLYCWSVAFLTHSSISYRSLLVNSSFYLEYIVNKRYINENNSEYLINMNIIWLTNWAMRTSRRAIWFWRILPIRRWCGVVSKLLVLHHYCLHQQFCGYWSHFYAQWKQETTILYFSLILQFQFRMPVLNFKLSIPELKLS